MTHTVTKERKETTKTSKSAKILPWAIAAVASAMLFANAPSKTQTSAEPIVRDFTEECSIVANEIYQTELTPEQSDSYYTSDYIKGTVNNDEPLDDKAINYKDVLNQHPDFVVTASGGCMTKVVIKDSNDNVIAEHLKPIRGIRVINANLTNKQISNLYSTIRLHLNGKSADYIQTLESGKTTDSNNVLTAYGALLPTFKDIGINNPKFEVFE